VSCALAQRERHIGVRMEQLERVSGLLTWAKFQLKQAKAHAEAKELVTVNPQAQAPEHEPVAA
jgi:ParB family chromosome partitioning protein